MELTVFCWNIFHGRDGPPDRSLYTRRAEWTRRTERNETHVQVNRDLWREYTDMLCGAKWDVALLQECPPRWQPGFARECGADVVPVAHLAQLAPRDQLGDRPRLARPDRLLGRRLQHDPRARAAGKLRDTKDIAIQERKPERRTMAFARTDGGLCVTCLHASTSPPRAEGELKMAAEKAIEWAGDDAPLVFGGDFNVRAHSSDVYTGARARLRPDGNHRG